MKRTASPTQVNVLSLAKSLKRDKSQMLTPSLPPASTTIAASIKAIKEEKDDMDVVRPEHQGREHPLNNRTVTRPTEIEPASIGDILNNNN